MAKLEIPPSVKLSIIDKLIINLLKGYIIKRGFNITIYNKQYINSSGNVGVGIKVN